MDTLGWVNRPNATGLPTGTHPACRVSPDLRPLSSMASSQDPPSTDPPARPAGTAAGPSAATGESPAAGPPPGGPPTGTPAAGLPTELFRGITCAEKFKNTTGVVNWSGYQISSEEMFVDFLSHTVRPRFQDLAEKNEYAAEMRALASTDMSTEYVERLLAAIPEPESDDVGEAIADCLLVSDSSRTIHWPWNTRRDRRSPRANLQGADLVGLTIEADGEVLLLLGEVKTSSEEVTPPTVTRKETGLVSQLLEKTTELDVLNTLLAWLRIRCISSEHKELFRKAAAQVISSRGKHLLFFGVLLRDTSPTEADLRNPAQKISEQISAPTRLHLVAWYFPLSAKLWGRYMTEAA